jgi:uncharacterized membrane protein YdfJ with MMPL/SSD domain
VITAAATIMICVLLALVLLPERAVKEFGLSLAVAVFLDAFVIRSLLPAVLELLGRWTWASRPARSKAPAGGDGAAREARRYGDGRGGVRRTAV